MLSKSMPVEVGAPGGHRLLAEEPQRPSGAGRASTPARSSSPRCRGRPPRDSPRRAVAPAASESCPAVLVACRCPSSSGCAAVHAMPWSFSGSVRVGSGGVRVDVRDDAWCRPRRRGRGWPDADVACRAAGRTPRSRPRRAAGTRSATWATGQWCWHSCTAAAGVGDHRRRRSPRRSARRPGPRPARRGRASGSSEVGVAALELGHPAPGERHHRVVAARTRPGTAAPRRPGRRRPGRTRSRPACGEVVVRAPDDHGRAWVSGRTAARSGPSTSPPSTRSSRCRRTAAPVSSRRSARSAAVDGPPSRRARATRSSRLSPAGFHNPIVAYFPEPQHPGPEHPTGPGPAATRAVAALPTPLGRTGPPAPAAYTPPVAAVEISELTMRYAGRAVVDGLTMRRPGPR